MLDVFFQEADNGLKGIIIRDKVEIQRPADELRNAVGKIELESGSSIRAFDIEHQPVHPVGSINELPLLYCIGFRDVLIHQGP